VSLADRCVEIDRSTISAVISHPEAVQTIVAPAHSLGLRAAAKARRAPGN
jgi:hypothetical protein